MTVTDAPEHRRRRALGGSALLFLRRLRLGPAVPLTIAALVGVTCLLFAALPRLFNDLADDGLRYHVAHAAPLARNVVGLEWTRLAPRRDGDPLSAIAERGARLQQTHPRSLRELIESRTFVVRSPRYVLQPDGDAVASVPGLTRYLTIRLQSDVRPHVRLVAGRLPAVSGARVQARTVDAVPIPGGQASGLSEQREVPLVEVALSTATARLLRLHVGERAVFTPDLEDVAVQGVPIREQQPLAIEVVGLFSVTDPQGPFWLGDQTLGAPEVTRTQDLEETFVYGQALVSPDGYARALAATRPLPLRYEYRHFVDPSRLDAGMLRQLEDDVAGLDARYQGAGPLDTRVETGLSSVLEEYRAARSQAETLLAVAVIGLLACALATVGLLGALSYSRRRAETELSRARGASSRQVLNTQATEALLLAGPAALAGWALATLAVDGRTSSLSIWLALTIVVGTTALLVGAIVGVARRPLGPPGREDIVIAPPSARRLVLEGLVAAAALLGVYLLHRRVLEGSGTGGEGTFDPYLAGVPVLLALACGIVVVRLYPFPVTGAARLAQRTRGLVLHLGLSRAARQPDLSAAPLVVLLLAVAIASFSLTMSSTLEAGQDRTGWREIGADLRVDAPADQSLPSSLISRLGSMAEVGRAHVLDAELATGAGSALLLALDLDAYERVVAGSPAAVRLPAELTTPPPVPGVVPALVSAGWPGGGFFQLELPHGNVGFIAVAERVTFPGVPPETPFVVVPLRELRRAGQPLAPNRLYLAGANGAAVRQAVQDESPRAEIGSRSAVVDRLRASPLVKSALRGFRAAVFLAALYAVLGVLLMALITARSRSRDLALVRTMGGSTRQAGFLAAVELTPSVVLALVVGIALGIVTPYLIAPGLDLAFYTGARPNPIVVPWLPTAALATALVAVVSATVLLVAVHARRARLDRVLRIGER